MIRRLLSCMFVSHPEDSRAFVTRTKIALQAGAETKQRKLVGLPKFLDLFVGAHGHVRRMLPIAIIVPVLVELLEIQVTALLAPNQRPLKVVL